MTQHHQCLPTTPPPPPTHYSISRFSPSRFPPLFFLLHLSLITLILPPPPPPLFNQLARRHTNLATWKCAVHHFRETKVSYHFSSFRSHPPPPNPAPSWHPPRCVMPRSRKRAAVTDVLNSCHIFYCCDKRLLKRRDVLLTLLPLLLLSLL